MVPWEFLLSPAAILLLVIGLARLEEWVLAPLRLSDEVRRLLETETADEVERQVARLLAPAVKPRARAAPGAPAPDAPLRVATQPLSSP